MKASFKLPLLLAAIVALVPAVNAQTVSYQVGPNFCGPVMLYCYNVDLKNAVGPGQDAYVWLDTSLKAPISSDFIAWRGYLGLDQATTDVANIVTSGKDPASGLPLTIAIPFSGTGYTGRLTIEMSYAKRTGRYAAGYNASITGGLMTITSQSTSKKVEPELQLPAPKLTLASLSWSIHPRKLNADYQYPGCLSTPVTTQPVGPPFQEGYETCQVMKSLCVTSDEYVFYQWVYWELCN